MNMYILLRSMPSWKATIRIIIQCTQKSELLLTQQNEEILVDESLEMFGFDIEGCA